MVKPVSKDRVRRAYLKLFESMDVHKVTHLYRFATDDWAFDDSIIEFTLIGDGFANCPCPRGTRVSTRLVHAFQLRDGKTCRENGYEIWRRADGDAIVCDDVPAGPHTEVFR